MTDRTILITRPREDSGEMVEALEAKGYKVFSEPLLSIEALPVMWPEERRYHGLVLTSTNALRQIPRGAYRTFPVYTVGARTAQEARKAGFENVFSADGDGGALEKFLAAQMPPPDKPLLHLCGTEGAHLAVPELTIERLPVYRADAAAAFSAGLLGLLDKNAIDAALFFSPRTAQAFARLIERAGRKDALSPIRALCISRAAAESLKSLPWWEIRAAASPDRESVLALLDQP